MSNPNDTIYTSPAATPDLPVDTSPVGTPNDFERSMQAAAAPHLAQQPTPAPQSSPRLLVIAGQLLVAGSVVGGGIFAIRQSSADLPVGSSAATEPTMLPWLFVGGVFVVGMLLLLQAWRLQRASE